MGKAADCRTLEPDAYTVRYVVLPKLDRHTTAGKTAYTEFVEAHPGATLIDEDDQATVDAIAAAVHEHPVGHLAVRHGEAELSGWFDDPETGSPCRIRPDYLRQTDGIMVDMKTTLDASSDAFQRSIHTFGYHVLAAMYAHGFEVITGTPLRDFLFLTVEKTPPFAVAVYRLDEDALPAGWRLYRRARTTWARCMERDHWPAYSNHVEAISLPPWALNHQPEGAPDAYL